MSMLLKSDITVNLLGFHKSSSEPQLIINVDYARIYLNYYETFYSV